MGGRSGRQVPPGLTSITRTAAAVDDDEGQWFNLNSTNLAPAVSSGISGSPVPLAQQLAAYTMSDDNDDGSNMEVVDGGQLEPSLSSLPSLSSSSESGRPLMTSVKRRRATSGSGSVSDNKSNSQSVLEGVFIDHSEGDELRWRGVSRRAMMRMARERREARKVLQHMA
ncbi:hypothetical protein IWW38_005866, partial [Coemansia aciculifera]